MAEVNRKEIIQTIRAFHALMEECDRKLNEIRRLSRKTQRSGRTLPAVLEETQLHLKERKEKLCAIWACYLALPETESRILSLLYENTPEREKYVEKIERVTAETGYSASHIARLASRGVNRIRERCGQ